jgi:hypothetical protein
VDRRLSVGQRRLRPLLLAAASVLAVVGCNQATTPASTSSAPAPLAALPLANSGAPPLAPAPTADALPPAPAAQVGELANPRDAYAYADSADAMNAGFGDAPPDYAVDYGGERPWVWQGDNQSARIAETLPDGSDRYYYYEPGQDTPYLVRDEGYSYGYDGGILVVIYGPDGGALARYDLERRAGYAGRFLARGRDMFDASRNRRREPVDEGRWRDRRDRIDAESQQWQSSAQANPDWRDYHQAHTQQDNSNWAAERFRREAEAARYDQQANDAPRAARDWQAAQAAQEIAARNGALGQQSAGNRRGFFGIGQPPAPNGVMQPQVMPVGPRQFMNGAPGADAAAQAQAQALAARQAQIQAAQLQAQAQAAHQAALQAAIAQAQAQAQAAAARQAALQATTNHQFQAAAAAQAAAARQAQIQAAERLAAARQAEAQALAAHQGQLQAAQLAAARQAQLQALHQAQIQAAQAAAAHQGQIQAAQLAAVRQAQLRAVQQAQIQAAQAAAAHQGQIQAAQLAVARQAQLQAAQAAAQRQAQIQAAQAAAAHQAELQALAARQAQIQSAQIAAARQAQIQAAQVAAARQAQFQAAQIAAARQAQIEAAQANAARQAQIQVAQAVSRQAQLQAVRQAQIQAAEAAAAARAKQQQGNTQANVH